MKPKIGVLFITSKWFRDVGLQAASSPVTDEVNRIADHIVQRLSEFMTPVYRGVLFSEEEARRAALDINHAGVDGLIVSPLMWCEDQILRAALKALPRLPIIACNFFPYESLPGFVSYQQMIKGSGLVGILQMSGFLKREGYEYQPVSGYYRDPRVYREIREHSLALAVSRELGGARCGVLPFRCDQMSTTYVDEFALRKLYGVELTYLELSQVKELAQKATGKEIEDFREHIKTQGYVVEVDERNLTQGIRYSLALEKVAAREGINILAMNDIIDEMHRAFGFRPCLANPRLSESGVVVVMEADIAAGMAMYALRLFTGQSPFYSELFTADLQQNALLMGHPGYHDTAHRDPGHPLKIVPDVEYENSDPFSGACVFFKYRSGPVTAVNSVFDGERIRWTVFQGHSLEGPPKMEGSCHLLCRPEVPIEELCSTAVRLGVSQHWIVIPGHVMGKLKYLCSWMGVGYRAVE